VKTVPGGGIPPEHPRHSIKLTFYDGGHSEWAIKYEDQKGRLLQTAQLAREADRPDLLNEISGEQLPEYTPREGDTNQSQIASSQARIEAQAEEARRQREAVLPDENPPDYDEAQMQAVNQRFDERAQEDAERS
jgi:WW domain-binding protein 2